MQGVGNDLGSMFYGKFAMLTNALDHFVILVPDAEAAADKYGLLLGRECDWKHHNPADGTTTAVFFLGNTSVELLGPSGDGPVGARIREILGDKPGALTTLVFNTDDIHETHYTASRRGLRPEEIVGQSATYNGLTRSWSRFRCGDPLFGDVKVFMLSNTEGVKVVIPPRAGAATRVDHIVLNTGNPERTMAAYGAKLDLRLALDRTNEKWGARFIFFRTHDLTIEVVQRLDGSMSSEDKDHLWGVTYEVNDLDDAHTRLTVAGVQVSEVRKGRKAGTRVMSVKSHDLGIPTLLLDNKGER